MRVEGWSNGPSFGRGGEAGRRMARGAAVWPWARAWALAGLQVMLIWALAGEAFAAQGLGQACGPLAPCGNGLSCQPFVQKCFHSPRREGQPCAPGFDCARGLNCEAGTQVCKRPAGRGESCFPTHPCAAGLSCQPGVQKCYDAPRQEGQPCAPGFGCAAGLLCEAGTQVCKKPGVLGEACNPTRPCASGFSCEPFVQRCYHSPRQSCEPCSPASACGSGLSCTVGIGKVIGDAVCRGPGRYQIRIVWAPSPPGVKQPSNRARQAVQAAVDRWRSIIQESLPDPVTTVKPGQDALSTLDWVQTLVPAGTSWQDLMIVVRIAGPNEDPDAFKRGSSVLAHAAAEYVDPVYGMPRLGMVEINEERMDSDVIDEAVGVLTHEIGHVLGFNKSFWASKGLLSSDQRSFVGPKAMAAWRGMGQSGGVPLQWDPAKTNLQPGGHWSADVVKETFRSELMRPFTADFLSLGIVSTMKITHLTTGALQDFGYVVQCEGGSGPRRLAANPSPAVTAALAAPPPPQAPTLQAPPAQTAAAGPGSAGACEAAVQGQVAWDYNGSTRWAPRNLARLCQQAEHLVEPARCFETVMHKGVNWGGGTRWEWQNALDLCQGSTNAQRTVDCFRARIQEGRPWNEAIGRCRQ